MSQAFYTIPGGRLLRIVDLSPDPAEAAARLRRLYPHGAALFRSKHRMRLRTAKAKRR